ncbi:MAG: nuclear transport factor 2 family protein [Mycobacterium kyogaense]|uniref:nuclear transport factor 2 family protein n=1 Tax=Mycobacterium kyogaense TaxID=2212479 RepID=UPI002FF66E8C
MMLDEFALQRLVHRYCRAVDRGDAELLRSLYHHGASDQHGGFSSGTATDLVAQITAARPYLKAMQHHVTTVNFMVGQGDLAGTAEGEVHMLAVHTVGAGDRDVDVIVGGRYLDKYEKHAGRWGFIHRMIVTDWARISDPSQTDLSHPITRNTAIGTLGDDDPSHSFFSLLGRGG